MLAQAEEAGVVVSGLSAVRFVMPFFLTPSTEEGSEESPFAPVHHIQIFTFGLIFCLLGNSLFRHTQYLRLSLNEIVVVNLSLALLPHSSVDQNTSFLELGSAEHETFFPEIEDVAFRMLISEAIMVAVVAEMTRSIAHDIVSMMSHNFGLVFLSFLFNYDELILIGSFELS